MAVVLPTSEKEELSLEWIDEALGRSDAFGYMSIVCTDTLAEFLVPVGIVAPTAELRGWCRISPREWL